MLSPDHSAWKILPIDVDEAVAMYDGQIHQWNPFTDMTEMSRWIGGSNILQVSMAAPDAFIHYAAWLWLMVSWPPISRPRQSLWEMFIRISRPARWRISTTSNPTAKPKMHKWNGGIIMGPFNPIRVSCPLLPFAICLVECYILSADVALLYISLITISYHTW